MRHRMIRRRNRGSLVRAILPAMLFCFINKAFALHIAGSVVDHDALPVSGAVVRLVGLNLQGSTDTNGMFSLDNAGVVYRPVPDGSMPAENLQRPATFTLGGRRFAPAVRQRSGVNFSASGRSFASQVVVRFPAGTVTRRIAVASAAPFQQSDTLLITHDTHLFRKLVVQLDTLSLAPVVMQDTSAVFSSAWEMLDKFFLDRYKLTYDPFGYATPESLYASVDEPFTVWFSHESAREYAELLTLKSIGCGIRTDSAAEGYSIKDVFIDSPAERAGIRRGDLIVKVGDHSAAGLSWSEFTGYLKGAAGDTVHLTVATGAAIRSVAVILDTFVSPSVFMDSLDETTAIVNITGFKVGTTRPGGTEEEFYEALEKLAWTKNLIIDLRGNGGGYLDQAIDCVSYLVPPGQPLIRWRGRELNILTAKSEETDSIFTSVPRMKLFTKNRLLILADGATASAAEVFITMMRTALPEIRLIGTTTYGKATGQVVAWCPDSTLAKVTCVRFSPMSGVSYDKVGIQPDIPVAEGENAVEVALRLLNEGAVDQK